MRLIDADALNKAFDRSEAIEEIYGSYGLPVISEVIDAAPTIDAEPVVRCKDCKYRKVSEYHYKDIGYCTTECTRGNERVIGTYGDGGYCPDGERKAEP